MKLSNSLDLTLIFQQFLEPDWELAEIKPTRATQRSTYDDNEGCCAAAHTIDKNLASPALTERADISWMKMELGKVQIVHKVIIYYRFYNNWFFEDYCSQSIDIYKSCIDDQNNVDVSVYHGEVQQKSCGTLQLTYGLEQSDQIYTLICNVEGDSVKLSKTTTGHIFVSEVVLIGTGLLA